MDGDKFEAELAAVAAGIRQYHGRTGTSMEMAVYLADGVASYRVYVATAQSVQFQFKAAEHLIAWLDDINAAINPFESAMARQRAEALEEQRIALDAERAAVAQEISELPKTQRILDAHQAAAARLASADDRLRLLGEAKDVVEKEAALREKTLQEVLKQATPEELAKTEELARAEADKRTKSQS